MTSIPPLRDPAAGEPTVLIRDNGCLADIEPAPPEVVEELVVERLTFRVDDCGVLQAGLRHERLLIFDAGGRAAFPSGLVPRVADVVRRAGYRVEVQDFAEPPVPAAMAVADALDADRRQLAAELAASRRGVVLTRSACERTAVIELAIELFAPAKVMVVTKTRREAWGIGKALRAGRQEPVAIFTRQHTTSDVRIQVGTAGSLDLVHAGVVILADATQALHNRIAHDVLLLARPRIYGLYDDRRRLTRIIHDSCPWFRNCLGVFQFGRC
jgi:hypothetical protein